jgi:hypothetical protein
MFRSFSIDIFEYITKLIYKKPIIQLMMGLYPHRATHTTLLLISTAAI